MNLQNPKTKVGEPKKLTVKEFMEEPKVIGDLEEQINKHGFIKGTKNHMEIEFLKSKSYEEINEMMNQFNDRSITQQETINELKETIQHALDIKNIWLMPDDVAHTFTEESAALAMMESTFIELLK